MVFLRSKAADNPMAEDPEEVTEVEDPDLPKGKSEEVYERQMAVGLALELSRGLTTSAAQLLKDAKLIRAYIFEE